MSDILRGPFIKSWDRAYFVGLLLLFFLVFHFLNDFLAVFIFIAGTAVYHWGKPVLDRHKQVKEAVPHSDYIPLKPQLIPRTAWGQNFRSEISDVQWNRITHYLRQKYNYACQLCNRNYKKEPESLQAHEKWEFDRENQKQILENILCVCEKCHHVIHWGRSCITFDNAYLNELKDHFYKVNYPVVAPKNALNKAIKEAKDNFDKLNMYNYTLSVDKGYKILADANETLNKPQDEVDEKNINEEGLSKEELTMEDQTEEF